MDITDLAFVSLSKYSIILEVDAMFLVCLDSTVILICLQKSLIIIHLQSIYNAIDFA